MLKIINRLLIAGLMVGFFFTPSLASTPQPRIVGGIESSQNAWPFMSALMYKSLGLSIDNQIHETVFFAQSSAQLFSGELVNCGKAFTTCTGVNGKLCLIERGETFFFEKVANCEAGGGIGALIYNNETGIFYGSLGRSSSNIPVVSITQATGLALLNHLGEVINIDYTNELSSVSFCGASYIGGKWLLTAAHCVKNVAPSIVFANVGGHDLEVDTNNVINISRIIVHENYREDYLDDDIALIELEFEPQAVNKIEIADETFLKTAIINEAGVVELGRGQQTPAVPEENPQPVLTPSELYEVDVNLVSNEACNASFKNYYSNRSESISDLVTEKMVCAGTPQGDVGTCFGDSGGPLVLQSGGVDYLLGATSWGLGCAVQGIYDVFTRVPYYKASIEKVIAGETAKLQNVDSTGNQNPVEPVITDLPREATFKGNDRNSKFLGAVNIGSLAVFILLFCFRVIRKTK